MTLNAAPYPSTLTPQESERHRRECEARHWLRVTGGDKDKVYDLMTRIAQKRGRGAADMLRRDMQEQYRIQQANHSQQGKPHA